MKIVSSHKSISWAIPEQKLTSRYFSKTPNSVSITPTCPLLSYMLFVGHCNPAGRRLVNEALRLAVLPCDALAAPCTVLFHHQEAKEL